LLLGHSCDIATDAEEPHFKPHARGTDSTIREIAKGRGVRSLNTRLELREVKTIEKMGKLPCRRDIVETGGAVGQGFAKELTSHQCVAWHVRKIRDYHVNLPCFAVCARICFATCAVDFSSDGHTTAESLSHCSSYIHS
jgi:hypothetical protein